MAPWIKGLLWLKSMESNRTVLNLELLNYFSNEKFRLLHAERICPWLFKFYENGWKFSEMVENSVGKGGIAHYEQFLLFPRSFQKTQENMGLFMKELTLFPKSPGFYVSAV